MFLYSGRQLRYFRCAGFFAARCLWAPGSRAGRRMLRHPSCSQRSSQPPGIYRCRRCAWLTKILRCFSNRQSRAEAGGPPWPCCPPQRFAQSCRSEAASRACQTGRLRRDRMTLRRASLRFPDSPRCRCKDAFARRSALPLLRISILCPFRYFFHRDSH